MLRSSPTNKLPHNKRWTQVAGQSWSQFMMWPDRLGEGLDPITDADVRDVWAAEALRRLEDVRSGKVETIPGDVVLARARSLLKK